MSLKVSNGKGMTAKAKIGGSSDQGKAKGKDKAAGKEAPKDAPKEAKAGKGQGSQQKNPVLVEVSPAKGKDKGKVEAPAPRAIEANPEFQAAMATLKENGTMSQKLRKQLNRLLAEANPAEAQAVPGAFAAGGSAPAGPPKEDKAGKLLLNLVKHLADPKSIIQGEGTWSCTVASLQATTAELAPARYARMVIDLATTGQTKTPGKKDILIKADHRGLADDTDKRDPIEDLFQESMQSAVQDWEKSRKGVGKEAPLGGGEDRVGRGAYGGSRRYGNGRYSAVKRYGGDGEGGSAEPTPDSQGSKRALTAEGYTYLVSKVFGERHDMLRPQPGAPLEREETSSLMRAALRRGHIPAGVIGEDPQTGKQTHHAVRIVGLVDEAGRDATRPDKKVDGQKPGLPAKVEIVDPQTGATSQVPIGRFLKDVEFMTLPYEVLHPPAAPGLPTALFNLSLQS
ncbi:MAG: hypothetical protein VKO64_03905 [Candidatus Sericytochromatia bacterium]|nr:hypothetical protein [Candidatus Sericytochromatia bacterium]